MLRRYLKYIRLVSKKPLLVLRILLNYFRLFIFKEQILRKVDLCLTLRCPCDCEKCSSAKMLDLERKELTVAEIEKAAADCRKLGAIQLNLTGGEPLLRQDIFEIIKALKPAQVFISINTTGLLLDKKFILKLKKARVDMIKMSLDSPLAAEHDRHRGNPGCFDKVMQNLKLIHEVGGVRSHLSTVTIPENIRSGKIQEILKIAEKYNSTLALTIPTPAGRWSNNYNNLINQDDRRILDELLKHPLVTEDTDTGYTEVKCPGGTECLYITAYGDIIPCSVLQLSFGNIKDESLTAIYQKMSKFPPLKESVTVCKAGEKKDFIDTWLKPVGKESLFPIDISKHPSFIKEKSGDKD